VTRILWTLEAVSDLESVRDFISLTSPHYGNVLAANLVESLDRVRDFPRSGRIVPELQREDTREVIYGLYRIVYRLLDDDNVAEVLTVFRSSRPFPLI
jgi:toxin ParE1/3/4